MANPRRTLLLRPFVALAAVAAFSACSGSGKPAAEETNAASAPSAGEKYAAGLAHAIDRGKEDRARGDLQAAVRAMEQYSIDHSSYPAASTCQELAAALHEARTGSIPMKDPWGNAYTCMSSENGYVLRSAGDDGEPGTSDDISVSGGSPGSP